MAARSAPPPDEQMSSRPDVIQWWMSGEHQLRPPYEPMEDRMIHRYFSEQPPFFDWTSKNGLMLEQSKTNRALFDTTHNRQAFEEQLRQHRGLEFMITGEPQQIPGAPAGTKSGVWNIRKQNREKKREDNGKVVDELETLGSYYIVGENVYQAPSVADVIGNRVLDATTNLQKFCEKAASLSSWTPTTGYYYIPQNLNKGNGASSTSGTPAHSREQSTVPGADTQYLRSSSLMPEGQASAHAHSTVSAKDTRLLAESLRMAIQFSDEYMDENPILGEPGHFSFTSSIAAVKKRKADEEAAAAKAAAESEGAAAKAEKPPSPPAVMTESKTGAKSEKDRKARMEAKAKRRKSKNARSAAATPAATPAASPQPSSSR
ncbi:mediator of rna polymerase ii transcription subunit 6 [Acrodontium crateriforme]|uniref:Mediator of RNA polymerase II transcription subunit 6 n=1 Tax=Acrodontium crateriforme TaxID=150365 RepID=A0AAQ3R4K4_9PEZI|nr:mediator of rna polymerase ii transcription subunit 6 [Acrodontium crateriforme]